MIKTIPGNEQSLPYIAYTVNLLIEQREQDKKNRDEQMRELETEIDRLKQDRNMLYSRIYKLEKKK